MSEQNKSTNKQSTQSKYHHFVPQFYLNYFTDSTGYLYLYDKEKKEVRKSLPRNVFGKNRLNTITYPDGSKGDWVEGMYSDIEGTVAPVLKKIADSEQQKTGITHMDKLYLSMFLSVQFWRLPIHKGLVEKAMKENDLSFIEASIRKDGKRVSKKEQDEFYEMVSKTDLFKKTYPVMAGVIRPVKNGSYDDLMNWHFMYQDPGFHLTSDNPIIYKDTPVENTIFKDLIFPITPSRVLYSCQNPPQETNNSLLINLQQFHQAERYVASNHEAYLKELASIYERIIESELDKIKSHIFSTL